jgi:hypothetical protein
MIDLNQGRAARQEDWKLAEEELLACVGIAIGLSHPLSDSQPRTGPVFHLRVTDKDYAVPLDLKPGTR